MSNEYIENKYVVTLLAWLVIKEIIEIKIAFPTHNTMNGIFHEKIGIFEFPGGDVIAFTGSANETISGHINNYESIDVYRSWSESDITRVITKKLQFEEALNNKACGLETVALSRKIVHDLKKLAANPKNIKPEINMWEHQEIAVERFLNKKRGILEMATGTGKTFTSCKILSKLFQNNLIKKAIITTSGNDLLNQWNKELSNTKIKNLRSLPIFNHYDEYHDLGRFVLCTSQCILIISRISLEFLFNRLQSCDKKEIAIIHDEVHGLGMPS